MAQLSETIQPENQPDIVLRRLTTGFMTTFVVRAAAELRLLDAFGAAPRPVGAVAEDLAVPRVTLVRLLRALTALGLFTETTVDCFAPTPAGELLRSDHPQSLHAFVEMFTDPVMTNAWQDLASSVRTGKTSFDERFGAPFFDHLKTEPAISALFNASMSQASRVVAEALPQAYDFSRFSTVLDIGGGDGTVLAGILRTNPELRGVIFDTEEGSAQAPERLAEAGVTERASVVTGDFFTSIPGGADLYVIKSILHDWDDDRCVRILRQCRAVCPPTGTLLIIEPVLPERVTETVPAGLYLSDLNMLVNVGGRERTCAEFAELCEQAGFVLTTTSPLSADVGFWYLEAKAA